MNTGNGLRCEQLHYKFKSLEIRSELNIRNKTLKTTCMYSRTFLQFALLLFNCKYNLCDKLHIKLHQPTLSLGMSIIQL